MRLNDRARNRQPQTNPIGKTFSGRIGAVEPVKEARQMFRRDCLTGILDLDRCNLIPIYADPDPNIPP